MTGTRTLHRGFPLPPDENRRLQILSTYQLLDGPAEPVLDLVAQLTADLCGTARAGVHILAAEHQHQIATAGMAPVVCRRGDAMCAITILEPGPVVVNDARTDPRFAGNPWVNGELGHISFYAASQLRVEGGHVIGTLCAFDDRPGELNAVQRSGLDQLAQMVVDVLDMRRRAWRVAKVLRDREQVMMELREEHRELARSNEALQQFAAQVSHDLRSPLTGVLGFIETLAEVDTIADDPRAKWMLDRAASTGHRMSHMIEDVLHDAAANGHAEFMPVPLGDIVTQVVEDLGTAIAEAAVRVEVGPLPVVDGNATQLRVLVQNLVGNAVKYRDPARPGLIRITGGPDSISVADNGRGIPPADRERVMELYTRVHTDVEGTGIGLATCRRIVATHGGTLAIGETPGGGATVTVTLPTA